VVPQWGGIYSGEYVMDDISMTTLGSDTAQNPLDGIRISEIGSASYRHERVRSSGDRPQRQKCKGHRRRLNLLD